MSRDLTLCLQEILQAVKRIPDDVRDREKPARVTSDSVAACSPSSARFPDGPVRVIPA